MIYVSKGLHRGANIAKDGPEVNLGALETDSREAHRCPQWIRENQLPCAQGPVGMARLDGSFALAKTE
jgi:hypothetical protein